MRRRCISCGYEAEKVYRCKKCGKFVCHKCINRGLCNDCFIEVDCIKYDPAYTYGELNEGVMK